ncbi:MAG: hypothetical protein JXA54_13745 [Candidatus Heimdallarchaeota archaeon]|nr:hypothetical protein [Candidatus Heimdallarchaeota archaeon]
MAQNRFTKIELSPSFKERLIKSFIAIIGFIIGTIGIIGALIVENLPEIVIFTTIFICALTIFFSVWRVIRIAMVKLYIDEDAIRYRDRFVWKKIDWSEVISVGQANDVDSNDEGVLKKIKSLLIVTNNGLKRFDMSAYSLTHGIETIDKIIDSRPSKENEDEEDFSY